MFRLGNNIIIMQSVDELNPFNGFWIHQIRTRSRPIRVNICILYTSILKYVIYWVLLCIFVQCTHYIIMHILVLYNKHDVEIGRSSFSRQIIIRSRRVRGSINHVWATYYCRFVAVVIYTYNIHARSTYIIHACTTADTWFTAPYISWHFVKMQYNLGPPRNPFWPDNNGRRTSGWWIYWFMSSEIVGHTECGGKK